MARRKISIAGILTAAVAMLTLGTGTASAVGKIEGHCSGYNTCYSNHLGHPFTGAVAVDGDLTRAPGSSFAIELLINGRVVCRVDGLSNADPAGSWYCYNVPPGDMVVRGLSDIPARGDIFVQARW